MTPGRPPSTCGSSPTAMRTAAAASSASSAVPSPQATRSLHRARARLPGDEPECVALVHLGGEHPDEAGPDGQHPQAACPLLPELGKQPRDRDRVAVEHQPAGRRARLRGGVARGVELTRLVDVPHRHADALGQAPLEHGVPRRGRHRQVTKQGAARVRDQRAVVTREHDGLDAQRRRGAARGPQRAAGDDREESAGADEVRERVAGAGHRRGLVVQQRAVEVAGDEQRPAAGSRAVHAPQRRSPAAGSSTVNRAPPPGASSAVMVPPWASTSARQMARPRPAPGVPRESWAR